MSFQNRIVESILCIALAGGVRGLGLLVVSAFFRSEIISRESVAGAGRAGVQPFLCEEGGDARARQAQPRARNGIHPPFSTPGRGKLSSSSRHSCMVWETYVQTSTACITHSCLYRMHLQRRDRPVLENLHDVFAARHAWSQQNFLMISCSSCFRMPRSVTR